MPLGEISIVDGGNAYSPILNKKAKSGCKSEENRVLRWLIRILEEQKRATSVKTDYWILEEEKEL